MEHKPKLERLHAWSWLLVLVLLALPLANLNAQGGGSAGPRIPMLEETGFRPIFDGKSLNGWEGDSGFWRVADGALVGESTPQNALKQNTFLIWRGGRPADFELKLEYRLTNGNSGIQYRSEELPEVGKFVLKGYQADMDAQHVYSGLIYEERGRRFLAPRGQFNFIAPGKPAATVGFVGDSAELREHIKDNDWNDLHIIAQGDTLIQLFNGRVISMLIDRDDAAGRRSGLIGIQLHTGPPMKIEVRNVRLKEQ